MCNSIRRAVGRNPPILLQHFPNSHPGPGVQPELAPPTRVVVVRRGWGVLNGLEDILWHEYHFILSLSGYSVSLQACSKNEMGHPSIFNTIQLSFTMNKHPDEVQRLMPARVQPQLIFARADLHSVCEQPRLENPSTPPTPNPGFMPTVAWSGRWVGGWGLGVGCDPGWELYTTSLWYQHNRQSCIFCLAD